jgi:hypothetical protein
LLDLFFQKYFAWLGCIRFPGRQEWEQRHHAKIMSGVVAFSVVLDVAVLVVIKMIYLKTRAE